jgi:hypothetical protein
MWKFMKGSVEFLGCDEGQSNNIENCLRVIWVKQKCQNGAERKMFLQIRAS